MCQLLLHHNINIFAKQCKYHHHFLQSTRLSRVLVVYIFSINLEYDHKKVLDYCWPITLPLQWFSQFFLIFQGFFLIYCNESSQKIWEGFMNFQHDSTSDFSIFVHILTVSLIYSTREKSIQLSRLSRGFYVKPSHSNSY